METFFFIISRLIDHTFIQYWQQKRVAVIALVTKGGYRCLDIIGDIVILFISLLLILFNKKYY